MEVNPEARAAQLAWLRRKDALTSIGVYVAAVANASAERYGRAVRHLMDQTAQRIADGRVDFGSAARAAGFSSTDDLRALLNKVRVLRRAHAQ